VDVEIDAHLPHYLPWSNHSIPEPDQTSPKRG